MKILLEGMEREKDRSGLKSVLRMTPNDNREFERPPLMRRGRYWDAMLELFEGSAAAGAELLSIESVGGKELHDEALVNGDLAASLFSLCILGERDMRFLWTHLKQIADQAWREMRGRHRLRFWQHRDGAGRAEDDSARVRRRRARGHARCARWSLTNAARLGRARIAATRIRFSRPSPVIRWRWKARLPPART